MMAPARTPEEPHGSLLLDIVQRLSVIETQNSHIISEQDEAVASRRLMHAKQDEFGAQLASIKSELATIAPKVAAHERWFLQIKGGTAVLIALWSLAIAAAGFVLREAWGWVSSHLTWK